jgi:SAM-dependent methyltransferase
MSDSSQAGFEDHFSGISGKYNCYRPKYPAALFEYLASLTSGHDLAWDCATGKCQAAVALIPHFRSVVATDASRLQITETDRGQDPERDPRNHIGRIMALAERVPLRSGSADLVTVAQALHWLRLPMFYEEVRRVVRPGGIIAVWCYEPHTVGAKVDAVVGRLCREVLGAFWPPQRKFVDDRYLSLPFPFHELEAPQFEIRERWDLAPFLGYLGTWSAAELHQEQTGRDSIDEVRADLEAAWGDPESKREVFWPIHLRVGRVVGLDPGSQ